MHKKQSFRLNSQKLKKATMLVSEFLTRKMQCHNVAEFVNTPVAPCPKAISIAPVKNCVRTERTET